jgi:hypothetical protein
LKRRVRYDFSTSKISAQVLIIGEATGANRGTNRYSQLIRINDFWMVRLIEGNFCEINDYLKTCPLASAFDSAGPPVTIEQFVLTFQLAQATQRTVSNLFQQFDLADRIAAALINRPDH